MKIRKVSTLMLCVMMIATMIAVAVPVNASGDPGSVVSTVDIDPDTMNLKSKGKWITTYIELSEGYDVNNIDISSVKLTVEYDEVPVDLVAPTSVGDHDNNGVSDLMVKFPRPPVYGLLSPGENIVIIKGELTTGESFLWQVFVTVIDKGHEHISEADPSSIEL